MTVATLNRILHHLHSRKLLNDAQLAEVLVAQSESGQNLDDVLVEKFQVSETDVLQAFASALQINYLNDLTPFTVPDDFVAKVPIIFARHYNLIGIERSNGTTRVATSEPLSVQPLDELSQLLGTEVETVFAPRSEITKLLNRAYQRNDELVEDTMDELKEDDIIGLSSEIEKTEDLLDIANNAPVIKLVNMMLFQALKMRASDVHLQPLEESVQVRFRIDGILYDMFVAPKNVQEAIISRIKVMGKMDIAERRIPQDGGATIKVGDSEVDLRISTVPTSFGERVVFRLLDRSARIYKLKDLGLSDEHYDRFNQLIHCSHGMILVTGPTGSGKTTTLYAALQQLDTKENNILTIEDPIEYKLSGISQVEVAEKKGLTFATGLRHFVRQDPDVILVGEIRDSETATIAIQSALTGHLVFSTVHTNDSVSTVTRLVDLGVEPYLVASSVIGVMAQRLVRLICPQCKAPYTPVPEELTKIGIRIEDLKGQVLYHGKGCEHCFNRGYSDRMGIYELLAVDDELREQIMNKDSASQLRATALRKGLRTLRMDGARKVLMGQTTVEEVMRITQMDVV